MRRGKTLLLVMCMLIFGCNNVRADDLELVSNAEIPPFIREIADAELVRGLGEYGLDGFTLTDDDVVRQSKIQVDGEIREYIVVYLNNGIEYIGSSTLAPDGTILETHAGPLETMIQKRQDEKGTSLYSWPLEEQAVFDTLYMASPSRNVSFALPKETDIDEESAISISRECVISTGYETDETAIDLTVERSYYTGLRIEGDKGSGEGKWMVRFSKDGQYVYQILLSAIDGTVYQVVDYGDLPSN